MVFLAVERALRNLEEQFLQEFYWNFGRRRTPTVYKIAWISDYQSLSEFESSHSSKFHVNFTSEVNPRQPSICPTSGPDVLQRLLQKGALVGDHAVRVVARSTKQRVTKGGRAKTLRTACGNGCSTFLLTFLLLLEESATLGSATVAVGTTTVTTRTTTVPIRLLYMAKLLEEPKVLPHFRNESVPI